MKTSAIKKVIIVGGGFGGINTAKTLADNPHFSVTVIDQKNYHLFQPLLYQVATAGLNPADIAAPIRAQFSSDSNIEVRWGKIEKVHLEQKTVSCDGENLKYDYLVMACGARHSYFGHPEWEEFAPGLKTIEQATEIRRRILTAFEQAENERDLVIQKSLLTFVIVGAGPTGVELAGAIAEISRTVLVKDFKKIDSSKARIILVEAGEKVLPAFTDSLSKKAKQDLSDLGVEVQTSSRVMDINERGVLIGSHFITTKNVFWAAGVQATMMSFEPQVSLDRSGRVNTKSDLSLSNYPDVFIIGDMASVEAGPGKTLPGLAPVAIQQGIYVGKIISDSLKSRVRKPFSYVDKGQMATIGKNRAILEFKGIKIHGFLAWLAWLLVHIFYLVGFKNRLSVMSIWIWSYIFSKRGSRLITNKEWKLD